MWRSTMTALLLFHLSTQNVQGSEQEPPRRSVTLPLADYLALLEEVSASEEAARLAQTRKEPDVFELVSQQVSMLLPEESSDYVDVSATFDVLFQGERFEPVELPVTGLARSVVVSPESTGSVRATERGVELTASRAGRYRVTVTSRARLVESLGARAFAVPPNLAAVAELELDLPSSLRWQAEGAVVSRESTADGRRVIGFTLPRGTSTKFRVHRDVEGEEGNDTLADVAVATLIELEPEGVLRHDIVSYHVSRGSMPRFTVRLPPGLDVSRLATDEGDAVLLVANDVLTVDRRELLRGEGYLVLTSRPRDTRRIPLDPVETALPVRERFLVLSSSIAADVEPSPEASFRRVDVSDVPETVLEATGRSPHAAWRLRDPPEGLSLLVEAKDPAETLETIVRERRSLTLLTKEGALVHRDRFTVRTTATTFELTLPSGAQLWSSRVNGTWVRAVERDGRVLVPLGFGLDGDETVELVSVAKLPVPTEKARLSLGLSEIIYPVLRHDWRLLLPEQNEYRYRAGSLRPVARHRQREPVLDGPPSSSTTLGPGGLSGMRVRVYDEDGLILPGATVTLRSLDTGRNFVATTDVRGQVWFPSLPSGYYGLEAGLAGFQTATYESFYLESGITPAYRVTLGLGTLSETITVTGEAPLIDTTSPGVTTTFGRSRGPISRGGGSGKSEVSYDELLAFEGEAEELRAGLASGVKPVPVHIPEQGKLLFLSGALPPNEVVVLLDVKPE